MNDKAKAFKKEFQALLLKHGVHVERQDKTERDDKGVEQPAGVMHWLELDDEPFNLGFLTKGYKG